MIYIVKSKLTLIFSRYFKLTKTDIWIIFLYVVSYLTFTFFIKSFDAYDKETSSLMYLNLITSSLYLPLFLLFFNFESRVKKSYRFTITFLLNLFYFSLLILMMLFIRYFQSPPSLYHLLNVKEAAALDSLLLIQLAGWEEFRILLILIVSSFLIYKKSFHYISVYKSKVILLKRFMFLLILSLHILFTFIFFNNFYWSYHEHPIKSIVKFGLLPTYSYELLNILGMQKTKKVAYPGTVVPKDNFEKDLLIRKELTNKPNIFIVQIESLDPWILDYQEKGKYVTPFLNSIRSKSLYFNNFFAQHSGGGSSDAELSTLTSLLPLKEYQGLNTSQLSRLSSLPRILSGAGYDTLAFHANDGNYFNRVENFKKIGFKHFFEGESFSGKASGWNSKDIEFFKQSINLLPVKKSKPIFSYFITIQSHTPFLNHETIVRNNPVANYILAMKEVDAAISYLVSTLERKYKDEDNIFILYSDHLSQSKGGHVHGKENVPLFIYSKLFMGREVKRLASHLDIAPTLLDILNLGDGDYFLGTTLNTKNNREVIFNDYTSLTAEGNSIVLTKGKANLSKFIVFSRYVLGI